MTNTAAEPATRRIRWRDPVLWPHVQAQVPDGHRAVTDLSEAARIGAAAFADLPVRQRQQYGWLWETALADGFQPSGLLVMCMADLAATLGHTSAIAPRRFKAWCVNHRVLVYVRGQLYPYGREGAPGERARCYLVLAPTEPRP